MPTQICPDCKAVFSTAQPAVSGAPRRCSKCAAKATRKSGGPPAISPLPQARPTQATGPAAPTLSTPLHSAETVDMYATREMSAPRIAGEDVPSGQKSTRIEAANTDPASSDPSETHAKQAANQLGPYHILDEIGRGGMGLVLKAHDGALKRDVAIKILLPDARKNPTHELRFIQEAQIAGQLEHPGIAPVHLFSRDDQGNGFFSMKLVSGQTLEVIVDKWHAGDAEIRAEFPLTRLLSIFERVCETIGFAHSHRVIHRDLKPANVMIGEYGEVWVLDWGLAKVLGEPDPREAAAAAENSAAVADSNIAAAVADPSTPEKPGKVRSSKDLAAHKRLAKLESNVTLDGTVVGTPGYMAPEQAAGEAIDEGVDIFGLGTLLYEILTGGAPFSGKTVRELLINSAEGRIKPVPKFVRGRPIPRPLAAIAEKCLSFERRDRYASAADLLADLRACAAGEPVAALPDSSAEKLKRFARRHGRGLAWAGAIGLVMLAIVAAAAVRVWRQDTVAREEREKRLQAEVEKKTAEAASVQKDEHARQLEIEREAERTQRLQAELDKQKVLAAGAEKAQRRLRAFEPYTEAMDLLMRGQLPERSAEFLRRALAIDPEFEEAQYALGEALRYSGVPAEAATAYLKADQLSRALSGKPNLKALLGAGFTYDGAGMYVEAEDAFIAADSGGSNDPLAVVGRIFRAEHTRKMKEACAVAEDVTKQAPHLWETHFALGYTLLEGVQDGLFPPEPTSTRALAELRKAQELSPRQAEVVSWLALGLARIGKTSEALDNFNQAIALEPKNGNRYVQRWSFNWDLNHASASSTAGMQDLETARRLGAPAMALKICEVRLVLANGDYEKGFNMFGEIAKDAHDWPSFTANWATLGVSLNHADEVRPVIERLEKNCPEYFATFVLRSMLVQASDLGAALRIIDDGLKIAPYSDALLIRRAELYFRMSRFESALADCDRVLELQSHNLRALTLKTMCLAVLKKPAEAAALYEQVKQQSPANSTDVVRLKAYLEKYARVP